MSCANAPERLRIGVFLVLCGVLSSSLAQAESLAPNSRGETVVLLDLYHRLPPANKDHRGQYDSSLGRYTWYDRLHPNGFSSLRIELMRNGFAVRSTTARITPESLRGADILLVVHPDSKKYLAKPNEITSEDVATIVDFVKKGGGLIVTANSYGDPHWPKEDFDLEGANRLAQAFGIKLNGDYTGFPDLEIPAGHRFLKAGLKLHYGNGCTMQILLNSEARAEVVLDYDGKPIIVLSRLGRGKALFIGDSGSWGNGNLLRPTVNNREVAVQLFTLVAPEKSARVRTSGKTISMGKKASHGGKYAIKVRQNVNTVYTFDLLNRLNPTMKRQRLAHFLDENSLFDLRVVPGEGTEMSEQSKPPESWITSGLKALLTSLNAALPETLTPGAEWTTEIPLQVLPFDTLKIPETRQVQATFRCLGPAEVEKTRCVKLYASAYVDLNGLEVTDFISPGEMQRLNVKNIAVVGGGENCEITYYVRLVDGMLWRGTINTNATLWFRIEKFVDIMHAGIGDLMPVFISQGVTFKLLP